ncbi:ribonuclease H-like domain-containing protein [Tanacetum coccineum]
MAGANQHLTYTEKNLVNVIDISYLRITVSHPNGIEALITKDLMDVKIMGIGKHVNGLGIPLNLWSECVLTACYLINSSVEDGHELDHVNFFNEIVHEHPDISYDDNDLNAHDQIDGGNSPKPSSPTLDLFEDDLGHPQGSNGSASEYEMAATSNLNTALSEDDVPNTVNTEHVQNIDNQPLRRSKRSSIFPNKYNEYVVDSKVKYGLERCGKWVFKIKYKSNGEIERYKARYVVNGYNQKEGVDFDETFTPVVKIVTIRCVINLDVQNNWVLYQLDISNAFLYDDLHDTVYMDLPKGFYSPNDKRVCKLKKSLYGLKQALRQWNAKLTQTLFENGFKQSKSDDSLFTKSDNGNFIALLVNVDDIIITGNDDVEIQKFKDFLRTKFQIKDLGKLKSFFEIEVIEIDQGLCLSQSKYCLDLLNEFGLLACKPSATLLEQNLAITNEPTNVDKVLDNITEYQKLIGKLIYLTHTRANISYYVHCLSQFIHKPLRSHLKIALKVLRYLKGNRGRGVHIVKQPKTSLEAFVDADWAKCIATRKSVTMVLWFLGKESGKSSRINDEVVQDQRQRDDNDLQDERQDQPKEE